MYVYLKEISDLKNQAECSGSNNTFYTSQT